MAPRFDLFLIYTDADEAWAEAQLLAPLGLPAARVLTQRGFSLGAPILTELQRGLVESRVTVLVLSEAFRQDGWSSFAGLLALDEGIKRHLSGALVPVFREECQITLPVDALVALRFRDAASWPSELARLQALLAAVGSERAPASAPAAEGGAPAASGAAFAPVDTQSEALLPHIYNRPHLCAMSADGDDLWIAGTRGAVLRCAGQRWELQHLPEGPALKREDCFSDDGYTFLALARGADGELWAVAEEAVLRCTQERWSAVAGSPAALRAVWAAGPGDLWFAGARGALYRCDGQTLQKVELGTQSHLNALWGSGPTDLWVAGSNAALFHYDGRRFTRVRLAEAEEQDLCALWGSGASDVWLSSRSRAFRYDGRAWARSPTPPGWGGELLHGSGATNVWAAGAFTLSRFDGRAWSAPEQLYTRIPFGERTITEPLQISGLFVHPSGEVWVLSTGEVQRGRLTHA